jgi:glycosidase
MQGNGFGRNYELGIGIMNKWFRKAIIYQIFIDRFAGYQANADWQKPIFLGGNIPGVTGRLQYLHDLGINTIWLSPVFKNTAYHGYHVTDFYSTDKRFGTEQQLRELVRQAHQRNIRVILDFVPNHCSRKHPFFIKARQDRHSEYRKWFYFNNLNNKYLCFLHFPELPKINLDHAPARSHLIGAAHYWLSTGIDGFRLDHAVGPSHRFWKIFGQEVKSVNPDAVLIGEAWLEGIDRTILNTIHIRYKYLRWLFKINPEDIEREYLGEFDGVLDFFFRHRITEYIAWKDDPQQYESRIRTVILKHYARFPETYYLPSFIENHDMNRFLYDAGQNRDKLKSALKLQFSLPQPPILYYGTETGLSQDEPISENVPFSDLQARKPMPWESLDYDMVNYCKELINERKKL